MTTYISSRCGLLGDAPLPKCTHHEGSIPYITWEEGTGTFEISLSNLDDPGDYLRRLAHQLTAFAHELDAATGKREPTGYDAPVLAEQPIPYALNERKAAEMHQ